MKSAPAPAALLILDMINLFDFDGGSALANNALKVLPAIETLRQRFEGSGAPVIFVNDNFSDWQHDLGQLIAVCQQRPGAVSAIATRAAPRPGDFHILKPRHSGFLATPLDILLRQLPVSRLVLCGIAADDCVLATAQDARMRDYDVWVPADAVAAKTEARKANALKLLRTTMELDVRTTKAVRGLFPA